MPFGSDECACRSCAKLYVASDLDRYLWCPACRRGVRRRGAIWARTVGLSSSLAVALYVNYAVRPSQPVLVYYAVILILTYILVSRIVLAIVQGYYRAVGTVPRSS